MLWNGNSALSADTDQTTPPGAVWSGFALFGYAILSETLMYEILRHLPYKYISTLFF